jgi:hypothetical protein
MTEFSHSLALRRTRRERRGGKRGLPCAGSLSLAVRRIKILAVFAVLVALVDASWGQTNTPTPLYVHFGYESSDSTKRLLSAQIRLGEAIFVGGDDYWKLTGSIERRGTNLVADLHGSTGSQSQFYKGVVKLETPFYGQGGAASGGVMPLWFAVSTNSDCKPLLESLEKSTKERLKRIK